MRVPVTSSNIASIGYDADTSVMEVEFKNGGIFLYEGVPAEKHAALLAAESIGKFFHAEVRPHYPCTKLEQGE